MYFYPEITGKRCEEQMDIHLNVTNSAVDYIAEAGFDATTRRRSSPGHSVQDRRPMANEPWRAKSSGETSCRYRYRNKEIRFIVK